jgi:large subunit ribosomal protein L29
MTTKELREKSVSELQNQLSDARKTLFTMRITKHVGQVEKTHLFVQLRRDIARMSTIISQKSAQA